MSLNFIRWKLRQFHLWNSLYKNIYNLQQLILSGNRFRHLPESILSGLFVLQHLSLSNNQLEHIYEILTKRKIKRWSSKMDQERILERKKAKKNWKELQAKHLFVELSSFSHQTTNIKKKGNRKLKANNFSLLLQFVWKKLKFLATNKHKYLAIESWI